MGAVAHLFLLCFLMLHLVAGMAEQDDRPDNSHRNRLRWLVFTMLPVILVPLVLYIVVGGQIKLSGLLLLALFILLLECIALFVYRCFRLERRNDRNPSVNTEGR